MIKDGYYMFIYSEIDPILNVMGLSLRHDHNLAVFHKKGNKVTLVCHLEFERFSGIKHHNVAFYCKEDAECFINRLLQPYKLQLDDFAGVFGMPGLTNDVEDLSYSSIPDLANIPYHTIAHLFTSLFLDSELFYENDIIALSFDGGPDSLIDKEVRKKNLFCGAVCKQGTIEYFPISSPGGYWLYVSNYFNIPEGTLMALAYATEARSLEEFTMLPSYYKETDKVYFINSINEIIERIMSYTEEDMGKKYASYDYRYSDEENKISMIMKVIQELSIKGIFQQIDCIVEKYSLSTEKVMIALSGGYALNCPTNTRIMEKYGFKKQLCAPCVNDGGLSIGMGLYYFYKNCGKFNYKLDGAYYGYSEEVNFDELLTKYKYYVEEVDEGYERAAEDILDSPVIWIDGNAEIGPRALGHRSIIGNPAKTEHKDLLNQYKQREWWRPVAPIVLEEDLGTWFQKAFSSPYMLNNFIVRQEVATEIPAVLHLDASARVQSLNAEDDYNLWKVLTKIKQITGIPIICNTSLNDKGEPIINTVEQAFNFALRKGIKIIYAYGKRISLKKHMAYRENTFLKRDVELFSKYVKNEEKLFANRNPHNLSKIDFLLYTFSPELKKYDITQKEEAMQVSKILRRLRKTNGDLMFFEYWVGKI